MTTTQTPPLTPRQSFWDTVGIVAKREIVQRFLSKSFIISTAITLVVILAAIVLVPRLGDLFDGGTTRVAATSEVASAHSSLEGVEWMEVPDDAAARAAVESETADAALVVDPSSPAGVKVLGLDTEPQGLVNALAIVPEVELLAPSAQASWIANLMGMGFGLLWMMSAITFGMSIANSVVEEKQTRIVEILLATVSSRALLTGKIVGNSAAALVQILAIVLVVAGGLAYNGTTMPVGNLTWPVIWFIILFLIGFVMVASLYAAAAALVSRSEDLANVQQPIMWIIMIPYMLIIFLSNNPLALTIMSYVPFSAPVAVPMRVFLGQSAAWEPVVSALLLAVTTAVIILVSAKIYDNGLLRTGKPMKWREGLKAEA